MSNFIQKRADSLGALPSKIEALRIRQEGILSRIESKTQELIDTRISATQTLQARVAALAAEDDAVNQERLTRGISASELPTISNSISTDLNRETPKKEDPQLRNEVAEINPRTSTISKSIRTNTEKAQARGQNPKKFAVSLSPEELNIVIDSYISLTGEVREDVVSLIGRGRGLLAPINNEAPVYDPFDLDSLLVEQELIGTQLRAIVNGRIIGYVSDSSEVIEDIKDLNAGINPINYTLA